MSYPVIYAENATDFFNLGLGTLPDATKVEVTEERNGEFTLSMTYLVDGLRANEIKKNRIIKVDAGHVLKGQRFVIKKINKQLVDRKMQYQVYAEHVSYITNDLQLKPKVSVSGSGDAAIKAWRSNIIDVNPLVVDSDIETNTSTSWTIDKVQSARQALGGVSGSLLDLWGGEYRFDNYHISLKKQRGTVSNTLLSYGRNITDFDQEENITDTYTSIYPFATYTENSSDSESKLLTLSELTIDSKYVGNYPNRKILPVDLTAKFAAGEKPTEAKLREFAKSYVTANDIGVPKVSIKLSFVDLSQNSNYEALQLLEVLDLCDTVPVRFTKLGVDTKTKVSRVVWDVLADHYTSMELGDTRYTISDMINNAVDTANEANQNSQEAQNSANHAVISADGHTMIFYGSGTPIAKNIGDIWYKPDGEYEIMYRWDGKVWAFVMSTKDTADAKKAADEASKEAEEAKKQANKAVDGANDAVAKAGFANDTADQAKSDAATAQKDATGALSDAQNALTNSNSAMADSAQARKDSATAIKDAADSLTSAKDAISKVGTLTTSVTSQFTAVNNELKSKVNQTDYDKLKGTVTSQQTEISQNASGIKLKADKSYADTINNNVVKNTSSIGLLNNQIALTVSKTELNNTLSSYATQTWTQSQIKSTADSINLSVTKVQTNLDNMELGSVNLIIRKDELVNRMIGPTGAIDPFAGSSVTKNIISVEPGKYLTLSRYDSVADNNFRFAFYDSAGAMILRSFDPADTPKVLTVPANAATLRVSYPTGARVKLERGQKGTEYSAAPEDLASEVQFSQLQLTVNGIQGTVQNKADQSQVTQLANQISLKADTTALNELKGTVDKQGSEITLNTNSIKLKADQSSVNTLKGTVDKQGSAIDVNTKAIALKASQSTVDTLTGRVSTAEGKITVQAGQIAQTVSKTELTYKLNGYATQTWTQSQIKQTADSINLSVSKVQNEVDGFNNKGRNYFLNSNFQDGTSKWNVTKDGLTVVADTNTFKMGTKSAIHIYGTVNKEFQGFRQDFMKLPYDLQTVKKGTKLYLSALLAKDGAPTSNLHIGIHYCDGNGKILGQVWHDIPASAIINGVATRKSLEFIAPVDFVQVNVMFYVVKGLEANYWITETKLESYKQTPWSLAPEDQVTEVQFSQLQITVNGIQGTVQNKADQSQVTQLAGQITSVVSDVSANSSQITQMKADINLRVKAGDVINQINISPESILIAGQKVHITGQTSIDKAVIKDAMIEDIKADKITAGTLNAANVNVINLNANNITTGTIKGANLSMNLNTGQVVFQKGYITSADGRIRFDLDSNYFRSLDYNNNGFEAKDGQFVWYSNWSGNAKNEIGRVMFDVLSEGNGGIAIQGKTGASLITNQAGVYVGTGGLNDKPDGVGISGNAFFWGNLDVMGKKNAVHVTSKGVVETPAYETAESYLGDIGESVTDEYGSALIRIDDLFNQIINTDHDYQVFISSYSNATTWVEERNATSFEVHSNIPNAKFAWEIKAKRRGYETDRLVKSEMKYEQLNKFHEKKVSA